VEIQIDSDDDDDDDDEDGGCGGGGGGSNITEPLVVLPSSVSLEDQDVSNCKHLYFAII
jgi:hypothetical protein